MKKTQAPPETKETLNDYLTIQEAADIFRVKYCTIFALCHTPDFPAVKVGKKWVIRRDHLEKWWLEKWEEKSLHFR